MPHTERCLTFSSGTQQLAGVLAEPRLAAKLGVVIVVGGPQYRVGSHRLFVRLARHLAAAGCAVLRFDHRGMGDATGELAPFDTLTPDIGAAADSLQVACPDVQQIVLLGLCDGASAALIYLAERVDPRVAGLCLLNPWVRSASSEAATRVRHYYLQRLMAPVFWRKLLAGGVGLGAIKGLAGDLAKASQKSVTAAESPAVPASQTVAAGLHTHSGFRERMLQGWQGFAGPTQLILSENDYTAKEFDGVVRSVPVWRRAHQRATVDCVWIPGADHTFSGPGDPAALFQHVRGWLVQNFQHAKLQAAPR